MSPMIPENQAAREWRERKGWSRAQLAEKIGWSARSVQVHEAGIFPNGKPLGERDRLRYRLACAAIDRNSRFFWGV